MEQEEGRDDMDPLVMAVPFTKPIRVTGKSFADDKRYVSTTHKGMEMRFQMAEMFNHFTEMEMKPTKCSVQALVYKWRQAMFTAKECLPRVTVEMHTGGVATIQHKDADDPQKTLGVQATAALSDGWAVEEAKSTADRTATCIRAGKAPPEL